MIPDRPVLFFDGICGLCNRAVDFVIRKDKNGALYVAPLQGKTAEELLPDKFREELDTLVLYTPGKLYLRSAALFEILKHTQSNWRWLRIFRFLPVVISDWFYNMVAGSRYRFFGKKESCRLPTPEERSRFLD